MTKEEFINTDFKFKDAFKNFRMLKDPYDGFKLLPAPRVHYDKSQTTRVVDQVKAAIEFSEVHELVVVDLSTAVGLC